MSIHFAVWLSCGLLSPLLSAAAAIECTGEKDDLLRKMPVGLPLPTECLMECTALIYARKVQLRDTRNVRLKDATEETGEYCWALDLKCNVGESLQHAFVVLPAEAGREQPTLRSTVPVAGPLRGHPGPDLLHESCGLRYDVTRHFGAGSAGTSLCVQVLAQQGPTAAADYSVPQCPPFLVTFWHHRPNVAQQGGGG